MPATRTRVPPQRAAADLLVPLELEPDPWAAGIAGLNLRATAWGEEVNGRVHSEIHAIPAQRLDTERELLGVYAVSDLINLRSALVGDYGLQTTNNPGDGRGGNCSGDSGGPILYRSSDIIVAVNSFGLNNTCKGNDFAYRVDTPEAHAFVTSFLD